MKVPMSWLREYADPKATTAEIAARLSVSTCGVERIVRRGPADTSGFVVGKVLSAEKHPNADRLQLTVVDVGGKQQQIVCGAWNFGAGATVAVALPGATLPNGLTLERRELRGQMSEGMILAEDEVDLGSDHDGIMLLADELEAGTPLADVLPLVEDVLDVETTPNRPDLLSIYGLAREVAALFDVPLAPWPGVDPPRAGDETIVVDVEDFDGCPRYLARLFRDVAIGPSPVWLKARILAAGMRPISNVVDVTNYVMVALGSPLHAFDHETLQGGTVGVRRARDGEEIRTLDGQLRKLQPSDLVIKDAERAVALAAIMGGAQTEVTPATTSILLEAANFEPVTILRTSERPMTNNSLRCCPARDAAHRRDEWRALGGGDGRARTAAGTSARRAAPGKDERACRPRRPSGRAARDPPQARVRARRRHGHRADVARTRRHTRGRPHRGGCALRSRRRSVHAAGAARRDRKAHAGAAAATHGRGRARRVRPLRGVYAEPHRAGSRP